MPPFVELNVGELKVVKLFADELKSVKLVPLPTYESLSPASTYIIKPSVTIVLLNVLPVIEVDDNMFPFISIYKRKRKLEI